MRLLWLILLLSSCHTSSSILLHNGHAHNDYEQNQPLFKALSLGYRSIEVDVHAWDHQLIVTHDSIDIAHSPTLQALYLNPLDSIINLQRGKGFPSIDIPLVLMIDLKTNKERALYNLVKILQPYNSLLTKYRDGAIHTGAIQILLSGDPPLATLQKINSPYLFIDGRFGVSYPDRLQPMVTRISAHYDKIYESFNGASRKQKLKQAIQLAHHQGRKVRFWATSDLPEVWQELIALGVDWIGVDHLERYVDWVKGNEEKGAIP